MVQRGLSILVVSTAPERRTVGRKFIDFIGGRDFLMSSPADQQRALATLPNGTPYWGSTSLNSVSGEIPVGFDFVTHDWTLEFWYRLSASPGATVSGPACGLPDGWAGSAGRLWFFVYNVSTGGLDLTQHTTASGTYRSASSAGISSNVDYCVHMLMPTGAGATIYLNNVAGTTGGAPSGTARVPDGSHRMMLRSGSFSTVGIAYPALYRRLLTAEERQRHIVTMTAA